MEHGQANSWKACSLGARITVATALGGLLVAGTQEVTPLGATPVVTRGGAR
jgi:hypothetical protein